MRGLDVAGAATQPNDTGDLHKRWRCQHGWPGVAYGATYDAHGGRWHDVKRMLNSTATCYTSADGELRESRYQITVTDGIDKGATLALEDGVALIGSHTSNDLVLHDNTVSRYHLELRAVAGGLKVTDVGSSNGTTHRGRRFEELLVRSKTRLRVGKRTLLSIEPTDSEVHLEDYADNEFGSVVGASSAMRHLFSLLAHVATLDCPLLLLGETGVGKKALARELHGRSARHDGPFHVIDCGTGDRDAIEADLFGHASRAADGSDQGLAGLAERAHRGTLFLDRVSGLPFDLQASVLQLIDRGAVQRRGATSTATVDVRVTAGATRDVSLMVEQGAFNRDLYLRLAMVEARVPALRDRREDIPLLVQRFAEDYAGRPVRLPRGLCEQLAQRDWPQNVTELKKAVARAVSELQQETG